MPNLGDFNAGETITGKFTSINSAGEPTALTGGVLSVYKEGSITQTTTGVTLTADFDGVTGLNHFAIVTTDAFYESGSNYELVLTVGSVGGTSVVGYAVATFSIGNRTTPASSFSASGFTIVAGSSGLLTYSDAIDYLVDFLGGAPDDKEQRFIRAAIQSAYREVTHQSQGWKYYLRKTRINLVARAEFTAAYTSATRALTTAGTWPTWAASGEVEIAGIVHEVETRDSATQLTLDATNCPSADIASTTVYLFRTAYTLPDDFLAMEDPEGEDNFGFSYVGPEEWLALERRHRSTGAPHLYSIIGDPNTYGRHAVVVNAIPTTAATLDFIYRRAPRRIRVSGYKSGEYTGGTIAVSAGAAAVTGTSTTFSTTSWEGAILRLSEDATAPTGLGGTNPYLEEIPISSVTSTTAMTLAANAVNTYSGRGFRVTDVLDCSPTMVQAILRRAELELAILTQMPEQRVALADAMYRAELIRALENDQRRPTNRAGVHWPEEGDRSLNELSRISISTNVA